MFRLRAAHLEAFETAARAEFEEEMLVHLEAHAPKQFEMIGKFEMRRVIQVGIRGAALYGLTNRGPVRFYIDLMCILGSNFDTDPLLPWAGKVLGTWKSGDQMAQADRLYDELLAYRAEVVGPDSVFEKAALRRVNPELFQSLLSPKAVSDGRVVLTLHDIYPQKAARAGQRAMETFVARGSMLAKSNAIAGGLGSSIVIILMYLFGHGCAADPLLPWIGQALRNCAGRSSSQEMELLFSTLMQHLERKLSGLE
jgi:hypothetical protein